MTTAALVEAGFSQHRAGKLDLAETLYRQVLAAEADNLNALQLLGALTFDTGRPAESAALLERAATVLHEHGTATPQHAVLYVNLGNSLRAVGRDGEAIAYYRRGLALAPEMPELHAGLAVAAKKQGDLAAAAAGYETALRLAGDRPDWLHNLASTYVMAGRVDAAIALYHRALTLDPGRSDTLRGLALALMSLARPDEAIEPLNLLAAAHPDDPGIHSELGNAQFAAKQLEAALRSFERVLALRPDDAEAFYAIGRIRHGQDKHDEAEAAYRQALRLKPNLAGALFNLGLLLYRVREQIPEAIALFEQVIAAAPDHADVHCALGNAWRTLMRSDEAIAAYRRYLERAPGSAMAHLLLGQALSEAGQKEEALAYFEKTVRLSQDQALVHLAHVDLGGALQALGRNQEALGHFRQALALAPLVTHPAAKAKTEFSALLVMAPGAYNTPYEYLIEAAEYESHILILLPDTAYDLAPLAARCDVVVNLVSDVDQSQAMLPVAATLIDRLGKPVINHPRKILSTSRESISALLAGIPCCRVAATRRHTGAALLAPDFPRQSAPKLPFLARLAGRHGGDEFEMIERAADLTLFVARHPDDDYFLIEYLDYRSPDGFFRKYRFFCLGAEILPYHLAIGTEWKIHHFRTDMASHVWMQAEEEAFLRAPEQVFNPAQFAALHAIREAVGLDFFGIDCALDQAGNVVVFEANATMLVHGRNEGFPYKTSAARRIKTAFAAMLAKAALG